MNSLSSCLFRNKADKKKQKYDRIRKEFKVISDKYKAKVNLLISNNVAIEQEIKCFMMLQSERFVYISKLLIGPAKRIIENSWKHFQNKIREVVQKSLTDQKCTNRSLLKQLKALSINSNIEAAEGEEFNVGFKLFGIRTRLNRYKGEDEIYFPMFSIEQLLDDGKSFSSFSSTESILSETDDSSRQIIRSTRTQKNVDLDYIPISDVSTGTRHIRSEKKVKTVRFSDGKSPNYSRIRSKYIAKTNDHSISSESDSDDFGIDYDSERYIRLGFEDDFLDASHIIRT